MVSDKADKTITVRIDLARQHRTYGKIVRTSSTLHAHDERNEANAGDTVRVVESRPLSRTKRWRLVESPGEGPLIDDPAGDTPEGGRQHRRPRDPLHPRVAAAPSAATPASAT